MPFGIHSAQEVFHKRINYLFEDLEGVETDIDDLLVWGKTIEEHDQRLQATPDRTKMIGMTLNPDLPWTQTNGRGSTTRSDEDRGNHHDNKVSCCL
jgi:hypothetical protein